MLLNQFARRWRSFWFSVGSRRALAEALLGALGLTALLVGFLWVSGLFPMQLVGMPYLYLVILLYGICAVFWCVVRQRFRSSGRWRWPREALVGLGLGLAPGLVAFGFTLWLMQQIVVNDPRREHVPLDIALKTALAAGAFALLMCALGYFSLRLAVRYWQLRRTRLQWELTNAHLMVALTGAGLISLLAIWIALSSSGQHPQNVLLTALFMLILSAMGILLILPPVVLFSYFFARRTTRRIKALTTATSALRVGDYSVQVPVVGQDEVAQLQADFNAMAAELDRAVRELQEERDTVARLLAARRELIASVSHELRTPVATLRSYLESTRVHWNGEPPATLRQDLEVMEHETVHLQTLIDDLFLLSRAEVGRLELHTEPADIGELARGVVAAVAPLAWEQSRIEVVVEASGELPLALVDGSRVEQSLRNLLHNAVRHTAPGGIVAVAVAPEDDGMLAVRVRDTGEGIALEDLPHVWERFYRGANTRNAPGNGSGLGLALVKELTEAMGGSVAVESEPGMGSCFTLRLPVAASSRAQLEKPAAMSLLAG
jgi:signal transduction histidine kinase